MESSLRKYSRCRCILLCWLHPPAKDSKKQAAKKGAINKRETGNVGELDIICFCCLSLPKNNTQSCMQATPENRRDQKIEVTHIYQL